MGSANPLPNINIFGLEEMPALNIEQRRKTWNNWYNNLPVNSPYKERLKTRNKEKRNKVSEYLKQIKLERGCEQCGETHPAALQFHHRDSNTKEIDLAEAANNGWSISRINKEIEKCIILCANCHLILHWEERQTGV